jgi:cytochrome c-type biogenesis protein CcmH/NrfF
MHAFETTLSAFGSKVVPFVSTNFLLVVAASLATVVSIVALVFVIRRNVGPSSGTLSPDKVSASDVNRQTDAVVELLIKKDFLKDLVSGYLEQQARRPRFTFREFVLFAMPAVVTFFLLGLTCYLVYTKPELVLDPKQGLPSFITQAFAAIIGYYFGTAASKA